MFQIQPLTAKDIASAMCLVEAAGWNQMPADWQRVIEYQPWGCFKATVNDRLVGTVTSTSYGQELAWIGMMLVDPAMRRQGIGRALMQQVIAALQAADVQTIKLDATPAGRPLYEQLGFVGQFDFQRWRRDQAVSCLTPSASTPDAIAIHAGLDQSAFGVNRQAWLCKLAVSSLVHSTQSGFGLLRTGRIADYLGPIVCNCSTEAHALAAKLVASSTRPIFWDIPSADSDVGNAARDMGFEPVRVLTRMVLGQDTTKPNLELQYAICDPATG